MRISLSLHPSGGLNTLLSMHLTKQYNWLVLSWCFISGYSSSHSQQDSQERWSFIKVLQGMRTQPEFTFFWVSIRHTGRLNLPIIQNLEQTYSHSIYFHLSYSLSSYFHYQVQNHYFSNYWVLQCFFLQISTNSLLLYFSETNEL